MSWWLDIRHALRAIARMPGLAAVVVLSLGIGIGVNTTCFSWMQAILTHPIPGVAGGARFDSIEPTTDAGLSPGAAWLEFVDLRRRLTSFRDVMAFRMAPFNVGEAPRNERTYGMFVSGNYFDVLGVKPQQGRLIAAADAAKAGAEPVIVISDAYWRAHFNGDPAAVGQRLRVNDRDLTIVGVAPPRFQGTVLGLAFDLFVPATIAPVLMSESRELDDRRVRGYAIVGDLTRGESLSHAQEEVDAAMRELAVAYPQSNAAIGAEVLPFWKALRGPQRLLLPAVILLQAILLLLLFVVCANVATLILARASARTREISVRLTLGAGTARVLRLILTECILLALAGAALGVIVASWGTNALRAVPVIAAMPIRFQTDLDAVSLIAAAVLGVLTGLAFGAPAAWQLARLDPMRALRSGASSSASSVTRHALMGIQVAFAVVVLVAAGIFLRMTSENGVDPGFKREGLLLAAYDLSGRPADNTAARRFALDVLARLQRQPSIQSAAIATAVPLDLHGMPSRGFAIDGRPIDPARPDTALANVVTPGYFSTMGIAFRSGTDFVSLDDVTTAPQAIVNEEFVARYLGGREPVGRRLTTGDKTYVIAGVVANTIYEAFDEAKKPAIFLSFRDRPSIRGEIHVRSREGTESTLGPIVARVVRDVDPSLPVYDVRTLNEHIERNLFLKRIPARMFAVLAPLLLVLAAIGIYGVVSYSVGQRRTEIGVRLALGATPRRVVAEVVTDGLKIIAVGVVGGWIIALLAVYRLAPERGVDWVVFAAVPATLLAVGATACWLPSRRAAAISPMAALKQA